MAAPSGLVRRSLGAACATVPEPALAGQFDYDVDLQPHLCRRAVLQCIGVKTVFLVFWKGSNWSIALRISQKSFTLSNLHLTSDMITETCSILRKSVTQQCDVADRVSHMGTL